MEARHRNLLLLAGAEASPDQNEIEGIRARRVDGVRPQQRALNRAQENKALPVAQSRPGDSLVEDGDVITLLLGRSRTAAKPQKAKQRCNEAGHGRRKDHQAPPMLRVSASGCAETMRSVALCLSPSHTARPAIMPS